MSQIDRNGGGGGDGESYHTFYIAENSYICVYIFHSNVYLNFSVLHWEQAKLQNKWHSNP